LLLNEFELLPLRLESQNFTIETVYHKRAYAFKYIIFWLQFKYII